METTTSPYAYIAEGLHQIAFVVRDLTAAQTFFTAHMGNMGSPRFYVIEDVQIDEQTYRGKPGNFRLHIALAYTGETQIELIQPLSGDSIYQEFLNKKGEGLHHLGFIVDDYDKAVSDLTGNGYPVIQSGRIGRNSGVRFAYMDTEATIGSIMEIFVLDERTR